MESHSGSSGRMVTGVTDDQGNDWVLAAAAHGVDPCRNSSEYWYVAGSFAGTSSIVAKFSGTCSSILRCYEVSGFLANPLDQSASAWAPGVDDSGLQNLGLTGQTTALNEIVFGVVNCTGSGNTYTGLPAAFTNNAAVSNAVADYGRTAQSGYQIVSGSTASATAAAPPANSPGRR